MANGFDCIGMMYGIPGGGVFFGIFALLLQLGILLLVILGIVYLWKQIKKKR